MTIAECYAALELPPGATWEDARRSHKLLATVWHPDRFTSNDGLRAQAEEKLKRINGAYTALKTHFAEGGLPWRGPESGAATADPGVYVDGKCFYLGTDPRFRSVSTFELGGRPAVVRVAKDGLTIVTVLRSGDIDEAVHYPAETIRGMDVRGTTWLAKGVTLNWHSYQPDTLLPQERVRLQASDPEGILDSFAASLEFRNEYFCQLFQKQIRERLCPVNGTQACVDERRKREAERERAAEAERQFSEEKRRQESPVADATNNEQTYWTAGVLIAATVLISAIVVPVVVGALGRNSANRASASLPSTTSESRQDTLVAKPIHPWDRVIAAVGAVRRDNSLGIQLVWIPPGSATLGSPITEEGRNENEHQLDVECDVGYWIGSFEVSQSQYRRLMGANPSYFRADGPGRIRLQPGTITSEFPVEYVSWEEAVAFCERFTQIEQAAGRLPVGWWYSLPSDAEWEYACRAGMTTTFTFGSTLSSTSANIQRNPFEDFREQLPMQCGSFQSNLWGAFDMHGNVSEWCFDLYQHQMTLAQDPDSALPNLAGELHVVRGGSFQDGPLRCRSASRYALEGTKRQINVGFRIVAMPVPDMPPN